MNENYRNVTVKEECKNQLDFISSISGLSRSRILEMLINGIYEVASGYESLCIDSDLSISQSAVYFYLSGKRKIVIQKNREMC